MFGRKKKKQSKDMTYFYLDALKNKQIPVLVLDPKWHELFPDFRKTDKIKKYTLSLKIIPFKLSAYKTYYFIGFLEVDVH